MTWVKQNILMQLSKKYNQNIYPKIKHRRGATRIKETLETLSLRTLTDKHRHAQIKTSKGKINAVESQDFEYFIMERNYCERFMQEIEGKKHFVDVGGYHGFYSILAGLETEKVTVFEPSPENLARLYLNLKMNTGRFDIRRKAVTDTEGTVKIRNDGNSKNHITESKDGVDTLSTYLDAEFEETDYPDIVKIDVEGAELKVLRGMEDILEKARPVMFVELHRQFIQDFGDTSAELYEYMHEKNYWVDFMMERGNQKLLVFKHLELK